MRGIYLVGCYPDTVRFRECAEAVAEAGFDFIEIGIPYNDPIADGPVIAAAIGEAIRQGITPDDVMNEIRRMDNRPSRYVMTYANIIYARGIAGFANEMKDFVNGLIVPDLPNRMAPLFQDMGCTLPLIPFATLETRPEDAAIISKSTAPFVYFIGVRGVTGAAADLDSAEIRNGVAAIRETSGKKVVVGFGIKTARDAERALAVADGYVIGTEAVRRQRDPDLLREYLASL